MRTPGERTGQRGTAPPGEVPRPEDVLRAADRGLSRGQRLLRSADFRETFAQGNRQAGRFLVLWVCRTDAAGLRLGVVASRRSFPRAVDRARAKRLLREAYRLNRFRLDPGCDVVLVARRDMLGAGRREVEKDLIETAQRAGILRIPA